MNPVILINDASGSFRLDWNYARIYFHDLSSSVRSYYITDIVSVREKFWEIHLREDVLETYRTQLLASTFFVERTSNSAYYDKGIYDPIVPKEYVPVSSPCAITNHIPQPSKSGVTLMTGGFEDDTDGINYVIVVARTGDPLALDNGIGQMPNRTESLLRGYLADSDNPSVYVYCCAYQTMINFVSYVSTHWTSVGSSVVALCKYPYAVPHNSAIYTIRLGGSDISTGSESVKSTYYPVNFNSIVLKDFDWQYINYSDSWERGDESYYIYLPYVGNISIDTTSVKQGDEIQIIYLPYYASNTCLVAVLNITRGLYLYIGTATISIQIPLTQTNDQAIRDEWTQIGIRSAVSLVGDGLKLAYGGGLAKVSAVGNIASNASSIITTALTTHHQSEVNMPVSQAGYNMNQSVIPFCTLPVYTETADSEDFVNQFGVPTMKHILLSDLQTSDSDVFVKCNVTYLPIKANGSEYSELISLLNQGIILYPSSS